MYDSMLDLLTLTNHQMHDSCYSAGAAHIPVAPPSSGNPVVPTGIGQKDSLIVQTYRTKLQTQEHIRTYVYIGRVP